MEGTTSADIGEYLVAGSAIFAGIINLVVALMSIKWREQQLKVLQSSERQSELFNERFAQTLRILERVLPRR